MKTTAEMMDVMLEFDRGRKVERRNLICVNWVDENLPTWDWSKNDFRVKRKPLEVNATVIGDNVIAWVHNSPMDANGKQRVVLFREVME